MLQFIIICLSMLISSLALAIEPELAKPDGIAGVFGPITHGIYGLLAALFAGLAAAIRYASKKTGIKLLRKAFSAVEWAIKTAVAEVWQVYVQECKEKSADGKLTKEEQDEALKMAIIKARYLLSLSGLISIVMKTFKLDSDLLDGFLRPHIEADIANRKLASKTGNPS